MIPKNTVNIPDILITEQTSNTYRMELYEEPVIKDFADKQEAMQQAIYKIIRTERYKHIIYSWNYGIELEDLFGMPVDYCTVELERRITEALLQDNRIKDVHSFEFDTKSERGTVLIKSFVANTIFGEAIIENGLEVNIA